MLQGLSGAAHASRLLDPALAKLGPLLVSDVLCAGIKVYCIATQLPGCPVYGHIIQDVSLVSTPSPCNWCLACYHTLDLTIPAWLLVFGFLCGQYVTQTLAPLQPRCSIASICGSYQCLTCARSCFMCLHRHSCRP